MMASRTNGLSRVVGKSITLALVAGSLIGALGTSLTASADADLTVVPSGNYSVDPTHAYIQFQYNHLGLSNPILSFEEFTIDMNLDNADPSKSTVAVNIDVGSVITGSEIFHDHLTGEKWFAAAANPQIMFKSTQVTGSGDNFQVTGDLTVKGVTKPVTLDVKVNATMESHPMMKVPVFGVSATGALKRSEWDLGANVPYISDDINIQIQAEMVQK